MGGTVYWLTTAPKSRSPRVRPSYGKPRGQRGVLSGSADNPRRGVLESYERFALKVPAPLLLIAQPRHSSAARRRRGPAKGGIRAAPVDLPAPSAMYREWWLHRTRSGRRARQGVIVSSATTRLRGSGAGDHCDARLHVDGEAIDGQAWRRQILVDGEQQTVVVQVTGPTGSATPPAPGQPSTRAGGASSRSSSPVASRCRGA
jgi:hypothetical protein